MMFAVQTIPNIQTIDLKYMESGHSYLEADSMHSTIETARKHQSIYSPREWELIIGSARIKPRPYVVNTLNHGDFIDVKHLASQFLKNTSKTIDGHVVQ